MGTVRQAHWLPDAIVREARSADKTQLASILSCSRVLLVQLETEECPLVAGLVESLKGPYAPIRERDALAFATKTFAVNSARSGRRSKQVDLRAQLKAFASRGARAIVPLRRRIATGRPETDRVLVGRARNNDVVLRDGTVSKFHAWFEADDQGDLFLADARTKNGTMLNGIPLSGGDLEPVRLGDEILFGTVKTLFCSVDALWEVLVEG
jgi:hypothetical protein